MKLTALEEAERISFVRMNLNLNSKKLSEKQEFKIAAGSQTGNPRFLKTLIEDIWNWIRRLSSTCKPRTMLSCTTWCSPDLRKTMALTFLAYIWGARRGLHLGTTSLLSLSLNC
jgi:hypothetical protein